MSFIPFKSAEQGTCYLSALLLKDSIMTFKNTCLTLFFILMLGIRLIGVPVESKDWNKPESICTSGHEDRVEIQNSASQILSVIELNNYSQNITEVHRLVTVSILSNRIVPISYNFRRINLTSIVTNFSSPVPIFIKGHALLN